MNRVLVEVKVIFVIALAVTLLLMYTFFRGVQASTIDDLSLEISRRMDCRKAIHAIIAEKGQILPSTQWTRYSDWTHAEQCSDELARMPGGKR